MRRWIALTVLLAACSQQSPSAPATPTWTNAAKRAVVNACRAVEGREQFDPRAWHEAMRHAAIAAENDGKWVDFSVDMELARDYDLGRSNGGGEAAGTVEATAYRDVLVQCKRL